MRLVPVLALMTSSFALAACGGAGGGGMNLLTGSSIVGGTSLSSAGTVASGGLPVCGIQQTNCIPASTGGGTTPLPDADGDGIPDSTDTDNGTGSGAGGNTTDIDNGNTTIAIEGSKLVIPTSGNTAKTLFTSTLTPTAAATTAKILSGTKPPDLRMAIDTNTGSNSTWAVPVTMKEYGPGTTKPDIFNGGTPEENVGAGSNYREYRALTGDRDELLQVWAWGESYGVQYRNASSGGEAKQQAWTFGGNATTNMPVGGTATYNGRFAATAKTSNWIPRTGSKIDPNGLWQIQGRTNLVADFGTASSVTGTLTPETWTKFDSESFKTYYTFDTTTGTGYLTGSGTPVNATDGPAHRIYQTVVGVNAKIGAPVGGVRSSTYSGEAILNGDFVTGDNPVYGGFFGNAAGETAGVFAANGVSPSPEGGMDGINDDRRGFINMSGTYHGCTPACPTPPLLP